MTFQSPNIEILPKYPLIIGDRMAEKNVLINLMKPEGA